MSHLFYASDAVIMPYSVTSGSGVMFDALAHGLPFVATDLGFFKEFARKGLGIAVKSRADEFSEALKVLDTNYPYYKKEVECFRSKLRWDLVAKKHIKLYTVALARRQKNWVIGPKAVSKV
jgi:glycosyltransferase involved in cell wall biosynthesis